MHKYVNSDLILSDKPSAVIEWAVPFFPQN